MNKKLKQRIDFLERRIDIGQWKLLRHKYELKGIKFTLKNQE